MTSFRLINQFQQRTLPQVESVTGSHKSSEISHRQIVPIYQTLDECKAEHVQCDT